MEQKKFKVCHETGVIITVGAVFALILSYVDNEVA